MNDILSFALLAVTSMVVITNPVIAPTAFMSLASNYPRSVQRAISRKTALVSVLVLFSFAIFGNLIFRLFSITLGAFQMAGGCILFSVAISMLQARSSRIKHTPEEMKEAMLREDIGIVPLAVPMVSGPGAITTVLVLSGQARWSVEMLILFGAILVAVGIIYFAMTHALKLQMLLGKSGMNIIGRLMGLLLAAVSVQFIINGIKSVLPDILKVVNHV